MDAATAIAALAAPFPPDRVSWRVGSTTKDKSKGMALAYIDARDVMHRLDQAVGPTNWQVDYVPMPNGTHCCRLGVRLDGEWVWRANGAGDTKTEAEKGGYSDAFKRAAVLFGVGRYLYDIESPWVKLVNERYIDKTELPRLRALLPGTPNATQTGNREDARADFARLGEQLRACTSLEAIDALIADNRALIDGMQVGWKPHWTTAVATQRQAVQGAELGRAA